MGNIWLGQPSQPPPQPPPSSEDRQLSQPLTLEALPMSDAPCLSGWYQLSASYNDQASPMLSEREFPLLGTPPHHQEPPAQPAEPSSWVSPARLPGPVRLVSVPILGTLQAHQETPDGCLGPTAPEDP